MKHAIGNATRTSVATLKSRQRLRAWPTVAGARVVCVRVSVCVCVCVCPSLVLSERLLALAQCHGFLPRAEPPNDPGGPHRSRQRRYLPSRSPSPTHLHIQSWKTLASRPRLRCLAGWLALRAHPGLHHINRRGGGRHRQREAAGAAAAAAEERHAGGALQRRDAEGRPAVHLGAGDRGPAVDWAERQRGRQRASDSGPAVGWTERQRARQGER